MDDPLQIRCGAARLAPGTKLCYFLVNPWEDSHLFRLKRDTRAIALLARAVQNRVYVLAYIDGFIVLDFTVIGALVLMLLRDPGAS